MLKYPHQRYKGMLLRRTNRGFLFRLHAAEKQKVCGWTGFNILVRDETDVNKDNIGYLPIIDAPATNMSTVFEVLNQSLESLSTRRR